MIPGRCTSSDTYQRCSKYTTSKQLEWTPEERETPHAPSRANISLSLARWIFRTRTLSWHQNRRKSMTRSMIHGTIFLWWMREGTGTLAVNLAMSLLMFSQAFPVITLTIISQLSSASMLSSIWKPKMPPGKWFRCAKAKAISPSNANTSVLHSSIIVRS